MKKYKVRFNDLLSYFPRKDSKIWTGLETLDGGIMIITEPGEFMEYTPGEFASEMVVISEEEFDLTNFLYAVGNQSD